MRKYLTNNVLLILSFIVLSPLINGCKKSTSDDKIIDIEKEFNIQLWEKLEETGSSLQFVVSTIKQQSCGGTRIDVSSNQIFNKLTITIKNLVFPQVCTGTAQPARDTLTVGKLDKGEYSLNINLKDVVLNSGTLSVDDKQYSMTMKNEDGITVTLPELMRVPNGTIWGNISYDNSQESKYLKFIENLNKIAVPLTAPNGNYGHFVVGSSKIDIKSGFESKKTNVKQIFHTLTKPMSELDNLIREYRSQGLDIKILTYTGKVY